MCVCVCVCVWFAEFHVQTRSKFCVLGDITYRYFENFFISHRRIL